VSQGRSLPADWQPAVHVLQYALASVGVSRAGDGYNILGVCRGVGLACSVHTNAGPVVESACGMLVLEGTMVRISNVFTNWPPGSVILVW